MDNFFNSKEDNNVLRKPNNPDCPDVSHPDKPEKPDHPAHPGKPDKPHGPITVLINGQEKKLPPHTATLSYEEIVRLAYGKISSNPDTIYTVAYSKGPAENPKGTLTRGRSVFVQEGMVFNVGESTKS